MVKRDPELSVIIPAYNEAGRLPRTLAHIATHLPALVPASEVIVVDDGSTDASRSLFARLESTYPLPLRIERHEENRGKGAAVRTGVAASRGQWLLLMDADNATPITELPRLWDRRGEAQIILGSRYLRGSDIRRAQPLVRRLISRGGNLLIRAVTGLVLTDTQNGFKLLAGQEARAIFKRATIDRWGFDIELLAIAKLDGHTILEVPVAWTDEAGSKLRAGRDAWRTLKELVKIRGNLLQGKYQDPISK